MCKIGYSLIAKGDICIKGESEPEVIVKLKSISSPHVEQSKRLN